MPHRKVWSPSLPDEVEFSISPGSAHQRPRADAVFELAACNEWADPRIAARTIVIDVIAVCWKSRNILMTSSLKGFTVLLPALQGKLVHLGAIYHEPLSLIQWHIIQSNNSRISEAGPNCSVRNGSGGSRPAHRRRHRSLYCRNLRSVAVRVCRRQGVHHAVCR